MHREHDLDLVGCVRFQPLCDLIDIHGGLQAEIHDLHFRAKPCGGIAPTDSKSPGCRHQHLVTGGHDIAQRGLPSGVAVANIHRYVMLRARDTPQIFHQGWHHINQLSGIDIGGRTMHRVQHSLGHHRRTGDREIAAPLRQIAEFGHGTSPHMQEEFPATYPQAAWRQSHKPRGAACPAP